MWRTGSDIKQWFAAWATPVSHSDNRSDGYTLFELLIVMTIVAMTVGTVSFLYRSPSRGVELKQVAATISSRIRDLRAAALQSRSDKVVQIDLAAREFSFGPGQRPIRLKRNMNLAVVSAQGEIKSPSLTGIRFFPNGSSTGGTIKIETDVNRTGKANARQGYEVRVNWLTGRVSSHRYSVN